jgi:Protein of unknown function (DUF2934)
MARKTTGTTTTTRSKKAATSILPAGMQGASESSQNGKSLNLEEEIRRRAYELYLQRRAAAGNTMGDENQDWLVAEREILSLHGGQEQHSA